MTLITALCAARSLALPAVLKDFRSALPAGSAYDVKTGRIIAGAGAILDGYDFRGTTLVCSGDNVTVRNSRFNAAAGWCSIDQYSHSGLTVDSCLFDGEKVARDFSDFVGCRDGLATITGCAFLNAPSDAVQINHGTVSGCYFAAAGFAPGAHADAIWVGKTTGPVEILGNFIDWRAVPGAVATNNAIRIVAEKGDIDGVSVHDNVLIGGAYTVAVAASAYRVSNVFVTGNLIGAGAYGDLYPGTDSAATVSGNFSLGKLKP